MIIWFPASGVVRAALAISLCALSGCAGPGVSPTASPAATSAPKAPSTAPAAAPTAPPSKQAAGPSKPAEQKSLKYGATGVSWNLVPEIIAQEKGFFASENLSVETIVAGQSAAVCQQLLAKAVEIGGCSMNDMIQAVEAGGAPLIVIMNETVTALQYGLLAKTAIKSWADLKGKTIMVGGPKDNTVFYVRAMARANGLRDDDYDFQYAGASSARLAALKSGAVDASLLSDPFDTQAELDGFTRIDDLLPKYVNADNYAGGGPVVLRDWGNDHPDEVARFIRSIVKAISWIYDPANKVDMFAVVGPKLNLSQEAFDRVYQKTTINMKQWSTDGRMKESAVQGVVQSLVELGSLKEPTPATKYFEMTYVDLAFQGAGR